MKFIAVFLVICSVFLFSSPGIDGNMLPHLENDCCKSASCTQRQKDARKKSYAEGLCNNMFSCVRCVFFFNVTVKAETLPEIRNTVSFVHSNIGVTSEYADSNWHPPRV